MYLTQQQKEKLEFETIPKEVKIYLTRIINQKVFSREHFNAQRNTALFYVNKANVVKGKPSIALGSEWEYDEDGSFTSLLFSELDNIFKWTDTVDFIEILLDYINMKLLDTACINDIFSKYEVPINIDNGRIEILEEVEEGSTLINQAHPNLKQLISRMESCLGSDDYSGVLHAAASVFEVLSKQTVNNPNVQNQAFGSFYALYDKTSKLPKKFKEFMLETYQQRSVMPNAGHGSTNVPTITEEEAIILNEMTKSISRIAIKIDQL
jgi:hypothetical protein